MCRRATPVDADGSGNPGGKECLGAQPDGIAERSRERGSNPRRGCRESSEERSHMKKVAEIIFEAGAPRIVAEIGCAFDIARILWAFAV